MFPTLRDVSEVIIDGKHAREEDMPQLETALVSNLLDAVRVSGLGLRV